MSGAINSVTILGNVGRDPEIRSTSSGERVASLSVATTDSWKDRTTGERKARTEWHRITIWGDGLVGIVERYVSKGDKIAIHGAQLQTRKWTDQSGQDRYTTEIVLRPFRGEFVLLGKGDGGGRDERQAASASDGQVADLDDDIPF